MRKQTGARSQGSMINNQLRQCDEALFSLYVTHCKLQVFAPFQDTSNNKCFFRGSGRKCSFVKSRSQIFKRKNRENTAVTTCLAGVEECEESCMLTQSEGRRHSIYSRKLRGQRGEASSGERTRRDMSELTVFKSVFMMIVSLQCMHARMLVCDLQHGRGDLDHFPSDKE